MFVLSKGLIVYQYQIAIAVDDYLNFKSTAARECKRRWCCDFFGTPNSIQSCIAHNKFMGKSRIDMKSDILCLIRINKVDREAVYIKIIRFK